MTQTKFFSANTQTNLEQTVNNFMLGKHITSITYSIAPSEFYMHGENNYQVAHYKHCCCVMYEDRC